VRLRLSVGRRSLLHLGLEGIEPVGDHIVRSVEQRPVVRSIIRTLVPMTRASSKTVTPAASAVDAKVSRMS
jgi:hypothetical protein